MQKKLEKVFSKHLQKQVKELSKQIIKRIQKRKKVKAEWKWDNKVLVRESWKQFTNKEKEKQDYPNARRTTESFFRKPASVIWSSYNWSMRTNAKSCR